MAPPETIAFGPFQLRPAQQLLSLNDRRIEIGARALDLLIALTERAGELVTKEELVARAWPDTVVDEANLRVQVGALRKALGDGRRGARYLVTVPGRGYRFVASVARGAPGDEGRAPLPSPSKGRNNLPPRLTRPVGRSEVVSAVAARVQQRRFLTIVGPGGIGKTTVAVAAAESLASEYPDGVCFVDLAPVAEERLVPGALAAALGLTAASSEPLARALAELAGRRLLLVLDGCEHVVGAAALLAEDVLKAAPDVHVLATSRERLRGEGEGIHRLGPLETPPESKWLSAAEALRYPAVELFVERAAGCLDEFELSDTDAPVVAEICRKLDGIALAIELIAGRMDAFGLRGLAAQLDDRMRLLTRNRRTALPRHQTLHAALDWSFEVLLDAERAVLARLGVFAGGFVIDSARAVAAEGDVAPEDVPELVAELVAKSLIAAETHEEPVVYRLLDTTRSYALEKLTQSGELGGAARRHADHFRELLLRWNESPDRRPAKTGWLDNVHAALGWALGAGGAARLGVALTIAAVPLWVQVSAMEECRLWVERALASLDPEDEADARQRLELLTAYGAALISRGAGTGQVEAVCRSALELAERAGDVGYQLRALWGLWQAHVADSDFEAASTDGSRFRELSEASPDPTDRAVADRLLGSALYLLGDRAGSRPHLERMVVGYIDPSRAATARFLTDQSLAARALLASLDWEEGRPERAWLAARALVDEALALGHDLTACNILSDCGCPLALLTGRLAAADELLTLLGERARVHRLENWLPFVEVFGEVLRVRRDPDALTSEALLVHVARLAAAPFHARMYTSFAELALALGRAGEVAKALAALDSVLLRAETKSRFWMLAEFLRVRGELLLLRGGRARAEAEATLRRALATAVEQGAVSWGLRAATSLARVCGDDGRTEEARAVLAPVYARFYEGFDTPDVAAARRELARFE